MHKLSLFTAALLAVSAAGAHAAPALMSAEWTAQACDAWNKDAALTDGLADKWIRNDKGRGYKIVQMYRTDCGDEYITELKIMSKDGKAMCVYGGKKTTAIDDDVDYLMHATTERWNEMGAGEYGPMRAMMFGRLKFTGPKMEAMSVMGPFEAFLRLPGKIPSDQACPK
ncbi:MAG: SCP2 sterol-binding domain-containing protein [Pseudomonadota bacterium]